MMIKKSIFLALFLPLVLIKGRAQGNDIDGSTYYVGYGTTNLPEIARIGNATSPYIPGLYLEGGKHLGDMKFIKGGIYMRSNAQRNNQNLRTLNMLPMVLNVGMEKAWQFDRVILSAGIMGYLSMSTRYNRISRFRTDDYGVGIAPNLSIGIALRDDLVLKIQTEVGFGMYRVFQNVGFVTRMVVEPDIRMMKTLSIGLQHHF
jgi:hypothetical protein